MASALAGDHGTLRSFPLAPLDHGLVMRVQKEVREKLEEVLPHQERHVEGQAAYAGLAAVAREAGGTDAAERVQRVLAQAPVEAGSRGTLGDILFTPWK